MKLDLFQAVMVSASIVRNTGATWSPSSIAIATNATPRKAILASIDGIVFEFIKAFRQGNGKSVPIEVEVSRRSLGLADAVGQGGSQRQLDLVQAWHGGSTPGWWGWWNWPYWWFQHNGFAEFRWTVKLEARASAKVEATWHYFWR